MIDFGHSLNTLLELSGVIPSYKSKKMPLLSATYRPFHEAVPNYFAAFKFDFLRFVATFI